MKRALLIFLGLACFVRADEKFDCDAYQTEHQAKAQQAMKSWHQESDPKKRDELAQQVVEEAVASEQPDLANEVLAGKPVTQAEIPIPTNAVPLQLSILKEWDLGSNSDAVIRRVGPQYFELWVAKNGWLFNERGEVQVQANPHRRDGWGGGWHGAFLPDGQWITTDLWGGDHRIYIFSSKGKLLRAFPAHASWARADETGTHWVVCTGNFVDGEFSGLKISPWGWRQKMGSILSRLHLPLPDPSWNLVEKVKNARAYVNPRELGSRGGYLILNAESEDRKLSIECQKAGHGMWIDFPRFTVTGPSLGWQHVIPNGWNTCNFGFFPSSASVWVGRDKYPTRPTHSSEKFRTWIFDPTGKAVGWIAAERIGDDPDGKRMWFVDAQGRLLKVAADGVTSEVLQPTLAGATGDNAPFAHVLFPDLKMGFFYTKPGHLVLARWP